MRIANRNFSPTLLAVALTIAAVALFVRLAFWQLSRAAEKDALQAKFAAGQSSVVELTAANAASLAQYQRVTANGHYVSAHQILLDSMPSAMGQPGYRVVTPFELQDARRSSSRTAAGCSSIAAGIVRAQLAAIFPTSQWKKPRARLPASSACCHAPVSGSQRRARTRAGRAS
jgi:hypothetical protein